MLHCREYGVCEQKLSAFCCMKLPIEHDTSRCCNCAAGAQCMARIGYCDRCAVLSHSQRYMITRRPGPTNVLKPHCCNCVAKTIGGKRFTQLSCFHCLCVGHFRCDIPNKQSYRQRQTCKALNAECRVGKRACVFVVCLRCAKLHCTGQQTVV